jgi:hypothetical protein
MLDWIEHQNTTYEQLRLRYQRFAEKEAQGVSRLYTELARAVTESDTLLHFIASLPTQKQQPNLVFAAVRHLYGTPSDAHHFADLIERHHQAIRDLILIRMTQTNEPGRCATLLPALCQLPQPLALLEVGASAGLCLLPDRWGYDYGRVQLEPRSLNALQAPIFPCRVNAATPLPNQLPQVVWRAGIDLNPINLSDPEDVAWLETLVWPGQEARAERLRAAIRVGQAEAPTVIKGDLVTSLHSVAAAAPRNATLVVFHSAVLAYVAPQDRLRFIRAVTDLGAIWISNEAPDVVPEIAAQLKQKPALDKFVLAVNGTPVAITAAHGQSLDWLEPSF